MEFDFFLIIFSQAVIIDQMECKMQSHKNNLVVNT